MSDPGPADATTRVLGAETSAEVGEPVADAYRPEGLVTWRLTEAGWMVLATDGRGL